MTSQERLARVPDYRRLRGRLVALQNLVVDGLTRDMLDEAASRLGLLRGGVPAFEAEYEIGAVVDFAIYDVRRHGQTRVERFVAARAAKLDAEGRTVLAAMAAQRYALLSVTGQEPGAGVSVADLLGGPTTFLFDIGLSQSAEPGLVVATRLVAPDGLTMTTGAGLPVAVVPDDGMEEFRAGIRQSGLLRLAEQGPGKRSELAEALIQVALERTSGVVMLTHDATDPSSPIVPLGPLDPFGHSLAGRPTPVLRGGRSAFGRPPARPKKRRG